MTKQELNSDIWLCGDVKHGEIQFGELQNENHIEFLKELQVLMLKYNIDKLDVCWKGTQIIKRQKL
jgi:hypothetical protein